VASGAKPKKLFMLFRNCIWNMPTFRIEGAGWDDIERNMLDPKDPVIAQVIGLEPRRGASGAASFLQDQAYPLQTHGGAMRQEVQRFAATLSGQDFETIKTAANARTSWENFRGGITAEANYDGLTDYAAFSMDPGRTFLPHFLQLAEQEGIALHFLRIRRRPHDNGRLPDPPEAPDYIAKLTAALSERGHALTDLNDDTELTLDLYAEGDHLDTKHRSWFTERLVKRLGPAVFA
jgi:hypothetical protein